MNIPNFIKEKIPSHLTKRVQTMIRDHLMKEYAEYRKVNYLLEYNPILPDQDLNMETELMFMYQWGES